MKDPIMANVSILKRRHKVARDYQETRIYRTNFEIYRFDFVKRTLHGTIMKQ